MKQTEESLAKRRRIDQKALNSYTIAEKRAAVLRKNAPKAIELAKKANEAIKELIELETSSREEANTKEEMFESDESRLSEISDAIEALIDKAELDE